MAQPEEIDLYETGNRIDHRGTLLNLMNKCDTYTYCEKKGSLEREYAKAGEA